MITSVSERLFVLLNALRGSLVVTRSDSGDNVAQQRGVVSNHERSNLLSRSNQRHQARSNTLPTVYRLSFRAPLRHA